MATEGDIVIVKSIEQTGSERLRQLLKGTLRGVAKPGFCRRLPGSQAHTLKHCPLFLKSVNFCAKQSHICFISLPEDHPWCLSMSLVYLVTKNTVSGQALQNPHCVEITSDTSRPPSLIPSALLAISADLCEKGPAVSGCGFPLSGVSDIQGCDCGLHPGGVAAAGP